MSEFHEKVKNKKGQTVRVGGLVVAWGSTREVRAIKNIGETFELRLDNDTYAWLDNVIVIPEPPPTPERFVRFETTTGPVYFDLEQVDAVTQPCGERIRLLLRSGQSIDFNSTFKDDMTRIMDAWIEYQNHRWKKEQRQ